MTAAEQIEGGDKCSGIVIRAIAVLWIGFCRLRMLKDSQWSREPVEVLNRRAGGPLPFRVH